MILGALVLDEPIEPRTLVAGAVIIVAVAVIVTARGRMSAPRAASPVEPPTPARAARRPTGHGGTAGRRAPDLTGTRGTIRTGCARALRSGRETVG